MVSLRERIAGGPLLVLPGAANALTARIIADAGFEAVYVTGAGVANTLLGVPDIGLLTVTEIAGQVSAMADAVELPLVVDADTGFGNAINTARAVRTLERAGASAVQLEDQSFPKRCGHFADKRVVPRDEMVQKIHAAVDSRRSAETLVIARTDAAAVNGLADAIDRAGAYRDAGADILFVEAPASLDDIRAVGAQLPGPKLLNIVRGGKTPELARAEISALGYDIALYANHALLGMIAGTQAALRALANETDAADAMASWDERQRLVDKPGYDALEARYATPAPTERPGFDNR